MPHKWSAKCRTEQLASQVFSSDIAFMAFSEKVYARLREKDLKILLISGRKRAGKDLLASGIADMLHAKQEFRVTRLPFALFLKQALANLLGPIIAAEMQDEGGQRDLHPERLFSVMNSDLKDTYETIYGPIRRTMQVFGTEVREQISTDLWLDCWVAEALRFNTKELVLVADLRFPSEQLYFQQHNIPHKVVKVVRAGQDTSDMHRSETGVDQIVPDFLLENNGTLEEFQAKSRELFVKLGL